MTPAIKEAGASARQPLSLLLPAPAVLIGRSVCRAGTDEIAQQLEEAWGLAGTIEAGLHPRQSMNPE